MFKGEAEINGEKVVQDTAVYAMDIANIRTLEQDAIIWRFELVPTCAAPAYAQGDGVCSEMKMSRRVRMFELTPRTKWFYRLDSIYDKGASSTGLHSNPGSGIRCLLSGDLHVRGTVAEESDNVNPGDYWYEEGTYPIVSTTYGDEVKTAFVRGMILPVEFAEISKNPAMWIEGPPKAIASWKCYAKQVVRLI